MCREQLWPALHHCFELRTVQCSSSRSSACSRTYCVYSPEKLEVEVEQAVLHNCLKLSSWLAWLKPCAARSQRQHIGHSLSTHGADITRHSAVSSMIGDQELGEFTVRLSAALFDSIHEGFVALLYAGG